MSASNLVGIQLTKDLLLSTKSRIYFSDSSQVGFYLLGIKSKDRCMQTHLQDLA